MTITGTISGAILPAFTIILLGFWLRSIRFPVYGFWRQAERITYNLFLPLLLFRSIATSTIPTAALTDIVGIIILAYALQVAACFACNAAIPLKPKQFASLFQGATRFNNYIGIALVVALYGESGLALYAVLITLAIPVSNLLNIAVMTHYATEDPFSLKMVAIRISRNPLIIGTFSGALVQFSNVNINLVLPVVDVLAKAALPLGLLCVGAAINRQEVKYMRWPLVATTTLKLAVFPFLMWLCTLLLNVSGEEQAVAVIFAALPCAASSTTLARQMGASVSLSANVTALTTLLAMGSLPIIVLLLAI